MNANNVLVVLELTSFNALQISMKSLKLSADYCAQVNYRVG